MNVHSSIRAKGSIKRNFKQHFKLGLIPFIFFLNILHTPPAVSATLDLVGKTESGIEGGSIFSPISLWYQDKVLYSVRSSFCGGDPNAVIDIWDVKNVHKPYLLNSLPHETDHFTQDVKVFDSSSGKILIRNNASCLSNETINAITLFNVDDPQNPILLSNINLGMTNSAAQSILNNVGFVTDNLTAFNVFPFKQNGDDYLAVAVDSYFQTFRIFDISDPNNPVLVGSFGVEDVFDPGVSNELTDFGRVFNALVWLINGNRLLQDITINHDASRAYLANQDAGMVTLDISDVSNPTLVSVAVSPSPVDGVIFSSASWMNQDDTVVVDVELDFGALENITPVIGNFQNLPTNIIPGVFLAKIFGDEFEANPLGNNITLSADTITVNSGPLIGNIYPVIEGSGNQPKLGTSVVTANAVWIGRACNGDTILNNDQFIPGDIAIVQRGACFFSDKLNNAVNLGASAIVVADNIFNPNSTDYGGLRIWDFSSPTMPSLASYFLTECAEATTLIPGCKLANTYSAVKVIVTQSDEDDVDRQLAFVAWGHDGVVVVDITDPYDPIEFARFRSEDDTVFIRDVHKDKHRPWIYALDQNGNVYILKLKGID